jgi:hypothetical protein
MNENLIGHELPVNKLAGKLFWKAPWWAKLNQEEKDSLVAIEHATPPAILIEYNREPPKTLKDHRGERIKWRCGEIGIVTGFGSVDRGVTSRPSRTMRGRSAYFQWNGSRLVGVSGASVWEIKHNRWWVCMLCSDEFRSIDFAHKGNWSVSPRTTHSDPAGLIHWSECPVNIKKAIVSIMDQCPTGQIPSANANYEALKILGWRLTVRNRDLFAYRSSYVTPA